LCEIKKYCRQYFFEKEFNLITPGNIGLTVTI